MDDNFDAIVIGSGLGGLTAGALFTGDHGKRVLVLEQNETFGGAATTYHRGGMTVEASLHETTDPRQTVDSKGAIFEAIGPVSGGRVRARERVAVGTEPSDRIPARHSARVRSPA